MTDGELFRSYDPIDGQDVGMDGIGTSVEIELETVTQFETIVVHDLGLGEQVRVEVRDPDSGEWRDLATPGCAELNWPGAISPCLGIVAMTVDIDPPISFSAVRVSGARVGEVSVWAAE